MCSKFMNVYMLYFVLFSNKRVAHILTLVIYYAFLILNIIKVIKIMWLAHAKNIGEPFMAHAKNLYNIPCGSFIDCMISLDECPLLIKNVLQQFMNLS